MSVQKKEPKAMHVVEALITEIEGYKKPAEYFDEIFYIIDHLTQYPYEYMFEVQLCAQ